MNILQKSQFLKKEADKILSKTNVVKILSKYGRVIMAGSYAYDLLTCRDIDFCLVVKKTTVDLAFRIGTDLSKIKNIDKMHFGKSYLRGKKSKGMIWSLKIIDKNKVWKIDIIIATKNIVDKIVNPGLEIKSLLTTEKRKIILKLKKKLSINKNFKKEFGSFDIYRAVLKHNVSSLAEWQKYWTSK